MLLALALTVALAPQAEPEPWWSLAPLARPAVPATDGRQCRTPVDAFVGRELQARGLTPAPEADRRTLIRRLTFDLHGLPPTPEAIAAFVADRAPDAYEQLVDALLASPRYGERQARHWLDLVHYADTHGYDKDKPRPNAWPYRDWVIGAFNDDLGYARFVQAQLAADVLFADDPSAIPALGFIAAGPWDFVGHVELREDTKDKNLTRSLDRDDMVMATMATFASTTVHCARCHDHKFDPIPQRDYYRLQAVFAGVERAERPWQDAATHALRRALQNQRDTLAAERARLEAGSGVPAISAIDTEIALLEQQSSTGGAVATRGTSLGYHSALTKNADTTKWVQVDLGAPLAFDAVVLFPAHERYGGHPGPGFGFPPRFRVEIADDSSFAAARVIADHTQDDFPHPGDDPYRIDVGASTARFVRVTATKLWHRTGDWIFALDELAVLAGDRNVAAGAAVTALDSIEAAPLWSRANAADGETNGRSLAVDPARSDQRRRLFERRARRQQIVTAALTLEQRQQHQDVLTRLAQTERQLAGLPAPQLVYAAATDFAAEGSFRPPGGPRPIHVLLRGEVERLGELVGAGALSCLPGLQAHFTGIADGDEGARRAALARWITDAGNPLTWRSIVNRVWQFDFGTGLVATPNDFGRMGERPTHPELLDWLACEFRDSGGSFKALHRLLLTSAVYRQASSPTDPSDADGRWLSHMPRRRLEAEAVRDAVLAVAGRLDLTMRGPPSQLFAFEDDHSPRYDYRAFDADSDAARRRSVYSFTVRSVPDPFMESLDCADPSLLTPQRLTTLTAPQALAMWNNPFMLANARQFAARLERQAVDPAARIELACRLTLGRAPTTDEARQFTDHARAHGLASLGRVLFNLNEFFFVD